MFMLADHVDVATGVDTHRDTHTGRPRCVRLPVLRLVRMTSCGAV